jgi:hypothetical protein
LYVSDALHGGMGMTDELGIALSFAISEERRCRRVSRSMRLDVAERRTSERIRG